MKKTTTALLLATILLLSLALPALASPTGASPSDIALWQTQHPAPQGEFGKITAVLGPDAAAPVIQQRLDSSQRGAVIDNTPRFALVLVTDGNILRYLTGAQLEAMFDSETYWDAPLFYLWTGDLIKYTTGGQTSYWVYDGVPMSYSGDKDTFRAQPISPLPSSIPIYTEQAYLDGLLQPGNFYDVNGWICQVLQYNASMTSFPISSNTIFIHPDSD